MPFGAERGSGDQASLEAWIGRCVINAAHDEARADSQVDVDADDIDLESMVPSDDGDSIVREAVLRLPQRQRDALFLRYYLDFDYRTIAEALDVEVGTVSATLHAARRSLSDALQEVSP